MRQTLFAFILVLLGVVAGPAQAAFKIQRVVSPGGIEAWLVEDHRIPLMALNLTFRGGAALDPKGKEGLAQMSAALLDEGAGPLDATAFQKELADKSISLSFGADFDNFSGGLKTLTQHRDRAFELLSLAISKPRFAPDAIERVRNEMITSIAASMGQPGWVARRRLMETVYAGHPYSRPAQGTLESLRKIGAPDIQGFVKTRFGRDQLLVTAAGDITAAELGPALDKIFAGIAAQATPFSVPAAKPASSGQTVVVPLNSPQTVITMATEGMVRSDPDWFAGQVVNYALGGGGFSSRLMEDVRGSGSKRGLSYGFSSALTPYREGGLLTAGGATKNATAGEVVTIVKNEFGKVHAEGITKSEIDDAKTYIAGSFPLSLTSTDRLSALLMQLRVQNLGIDYLERRDSLINAVTDADTRRVATRLLDPAKLTVVLAGQPQGLPKDSQAQAQ